MTSSQVNIMSYHFAIWSTKVQVKIPDSIICRHLEPLIGEVKQNRFARLPCHSETSVIMQDQTNILSVQHTAWGVQTNIHRYEPWEGELMWLYILWAGWNSGRKTLNISNIFQLLFHTTQRKIRSLNPAFHSVVPLLSPWLLRQCNKCWIWTFQWTKKDSFVRLISIQCVQH